MKTRLITSVTENEYMILVEMDLDSLPVVGETILTDGGRVWRIRGRAFEVSTSQVPLATTMTIGRSMRKITEMVCSLLLDLEAGPPLELPEGPQSAAVKLS